MKVLVTGGLGFIGSNFILKLLDNSEYSVVNIDAELQGSNHSNLTKIENSKNYSFVKGNITNKKLMEKLISENDVVVNFAAESFVDKSILDTNPFLVSNIRGTYTILEVIKEQKKKLLQISTDEVYGSLKSNFSAEEDTRFNPSSPYAATKAAAELLIKRDEGRKSMTAQVIGSQHGNVPKQAQALGQGDSHSETTCQSGSAGHCNALDDWMAFQSHVKQGKEIVDMFPNGDFRHHAAILDVRGNLASHPFPVNTMLRIEKS